MSVTSVFTSRPTNLPPQFEAAYKPFHTYVEKNFKIRLRRLGDTDHSDEAPLTAIIELMSECKGAIVLGYPQIEIHQHVRKNISVDKDATMMFPTPWNQIEGSLAYGAKLPVLVVGHPGIGGGIFDHGVTGKFILSQDLTDKKWFLKQPFQQLLERWAKKIRSAK